MSVVKHLFDLLTGRSLIVIEEDVSTSDPENPPTPSVLDLQQYIVTEVSTSQVVSTYTEGDPNLFSFTTGSNDLTFKIYETYSMTIFNIIFRILKADDSPGTITVLDYEDNIVCVLRYVDEWIDIMYTAQTTYKKM